MGELIMVGDRVLVSVEDGERKTKTGLVLPASVAEKEKVQGEMWSQIKEAIRYLPLQARPGDHAFFLRKEAIEIEFEGKSYLIIPHGAILALHRSHVDDILENLGRMDDIDHADDRDSRS
jgi:chaperonin GroES